jgi:hypothetical protein
VMGFCPMQYECIGIPFFRRDVKAVHFRLSSRQSRGIRCVTLTPATAIFRLASESRQH